MVPLEKLAVIVICFLVMSGLYFLLMKTKMGKAMRAVKLDNEVASLQGINTNRIYLIAFAAGVQRAGSFNDKAGLWFYKMTDLFPGHSWAVVGFYGHPKLSYYRAKQVFAPQTVFLQYEKYDWQADEAFKAAIHVSNDSGRVFRGRQPAW
jgi:hypothetical protein